MSSSVRRRPARYEDLLALPENVVGEIVDGELHVSPRPASPHAFASSSIGGELHSPFQKGKGGPGGWWIVFEPELHFDADVLVPDLAGWRRERLPAFPLAPAFTLAPDWVCEVVSPGTARLDRMKKLPVYARQGVAWAWLVDPLARTLEVFERQGEHWVLLEVLGESGKARVKPFDAVEIELGDLWPPQPPAEAGIP